MKPAARVQFSTKNFAMFSTVADLASQWEDISAAVDLFQAELEGKRVLHWAEASTFAAATWSAESRRFFDMHRNEPSDKSDQIDLQQLYEARGVSLVWRHSLATI